MSRDKRPTTTDPYATLFNLFPHELDRLLAFQLLTRNELYFPYPGFWASVKMGDRRKPGTSLGAGSQGTRHVLRAHDQQMTQESFV